jgi:hypothetical protein
MSDDHIIAQRYKKRNFPRRVYHPVTGRAVNAQYLRFIIDESEPAKKHLRQREQYLTQIVTIEAQGEILQARCHALPDRPQMGSGRKAITAFSAKARKNMLDTVSRLDWTIPATFITLTYHRNMLNASRAKRDLRALLKRWYRRFGNIPVLWKMEPQKRGAWHFHLIVWNMPFLEKKELLEDWREIAEDATITEVKIEPIRTAKKARSYVAKYCAKKVAINYVVTLLALLWKLKTTIVVALCLDHLPNLAVIQKPGRFWGIENRKNLVWAILKTFSIILDQDFHNFKRAARRKWSGINRNKHAGFTLYVQHPDQWIDYMFYLIGLSCSVS